MSNKSYLLTGASGFLGRHLLARLGSNTVTVGREAQNEKIWDLTEVIPDLPMVDCVIHAAGKAHSVPRSAAEERLFYEVNYQGTLNLLRVLEDNPPRGFIFISTVAVYGLYQGEKINENAKLSGNTPYAQSKKQAEQAVQAWCENRNVSYLILRLPLVVGDNPPGNLGVIWQMICKGRYLRIQGNVARKSMVLAEDVAQLLANWKGTSGIYNLTDGQHPRFCDLEDALARTCGKKIRWQLPFSFLKTIGRGGDYLEEYSIPFPLTSDRLQKMTQTLTFSDAKARDELGWSPRPVLDYLATLRPDFSKP